MFPKSKQRFRLAIFASIFLITSLCAAEKEPRTLAGRAEGPPHTLASPSPTSCTCDCLVGFGGPLVSITPVASQSALLLGARGGAVLRRHFVLGAAGFGLVTEPSMPASAQLGPGSHRIKLDAGGFWFAYVVSPEWLVHPSFGVLVGGGSVSYRVTEQAPGLPATDATSSFFMAEPEIEGDINVTRFMRIGVGAYYRFVVNVKLEDKLKNGDVGGPGALLAVKFGVY